VLRSVCLPAAFTREGLLVYRCETWWWCGCGWGCGGSGGGGCGGGGGGGDDDDDHVSLRHTQSSVHNCNNFSGSNVYEVGADVGCCLR
jgi:hypothetical protein